jgi:DNA-binding protein HU-beta
MPVKKTAKGVPSPIVPLRHLAAKLAEVHSVPKKHAETILADLVGLVTKHLKKGDRTVGLGILQVPSVLPGWAALLRPERPSRLR